MAINNGRILLFISIINLLVSVIITYLGKLSSNKIENLNYKLDDINLNLTVSYSGGYVAIILFLFSIITFYLSRYTDKEDNISSSSSDGDNVSINSLSSYGDNVSINSLSDGDDLSIQSRVSDFSDMSVSSDEHGINTTHSGTPTGTLSATITSPSTGTLSATTNSSIPNLSISVYNSRGEDTSMTYIYKETNNWYDPEKNMEMYINSDNDIVFKPNDSRSYKTLRLSPENKNIYDNNNSVIGNYTGSINDNNIKIYLRKDQK